MSIVKGQLIDDIILRVTKGSPSDDLELEPRQIAFWFDIVAKTAVPDYLNQKIRAGEMIDPDLIIVEDNKTATVEDVVMLAPASDRVYITITKPPMVLKNDAGIIRIITEEGTPVNNAALPYLDTINALTFGKPSRENLLYTRINQKIYIHGLNPKHVGIISFSVYYVPTIDLSALQDNEEVKLPDTLVAIISEQVERMALKEIYQVDPDLQNDGEDDNNRPSGQ